MPATESQAFLLTPPGAAAIAVVRITGTLVVPFLSEHFSRTARLGRVVHGDLHDGDRLIDDPVVAMITPTAADINLHGGPWVVQSLLDLLRRSGFQVAETTPIPLPAEVVHVHPSDPHDPFSAQRLERDALAHLPLARTELGVRMLLAQPTAWRTFLEASPTADDRERVRADRTLDRLLRPARVAIVGAANVGKSTLANRLFGQQRSIIADLPGTTRDWVGELAEIDGIPVFLVDTPGIRNTDDPIEQAAIAGAVAEIASAEVVVVVLDAARSLDVEQLTPVDRYPNAIVVANKADRPAVWCREVLGNRPLHLIVATSGEGVNGLTTEILRQLKCFDLNPMSPKCWTAEQYKAIDDRVATLRHRS